MNIEHLLAYLPEPAESDVCVLEDARSGAEIFSGELEDLQNWLAENPRQLLFTRIVRVSDGAILA